MSDRGMMKWAPFSAVVPGNYLVNQIEAMKRKIIKPCLDEDKKEEIERLIIEAYNNKDTIKLKLYRDGRLYIKEGKIAHLDAINKKIVLGDNYQLFFSQIIDVLC